MHGVKLGFSCIGDGTDIPKLTSTILTISHCPNGVKEVGFFPPSWFWIQSINCFFFSSSFFILYFYLVNPLPFANCCGYFSKVTCCFFSFFCPPAFWLCLFNSIPFLLFLILFLPSEWQLASNCHEHSFFLYLNCNNPNAHKASPRWSYCLMTRFMFWSNSHRVWFF